MNLDPDDPVPRGSRYSIRTRVVLALNAFVLCLVLAFGWIAERMAGQVVEDRFAREMLTGVSVFLENNGFPHSDSMMRYLKEIFSADWVITEDGGHGILASSLPARRQEEFRETAPQVGDAGALSLGGLKYRVDSAHVSSPDTGAGEASPSRRLYMLVPYSVFEEARSLAHAEVRKLALPAAALATAAAILFGITISRPIRKLAGEMDQLASRDVSDPRMLSRRLITGPREISHLASSFYRLMDRLSHTQRELARNERLATLGKVCLSVAHELRNPLSGIKMNVRVLKDERDASTPDPGLEEILREIDRMELYLNELMNLSSEARSTPVAPTREEVRLSDLAESVLGILEGRCRHSRIEVHLLRPPGEPTVRVDPNQVRQAMMNLIVNAIEAMAGGGTMTLAVRSTPDAVVFSVQDTGPGVPESEDDIFEAFVTRKPNGVGLGLYLCKQIIQRHDGRILYESSPQGSEFRFELPKASSPPASPGEPGNATAGRGLS